MCQKISDLALKAAEPDVGSDELRAHRRLTCLSCNRPEKRDCTTAMLSPNGCDPERISNRYPSLKTEH